MRLLVWRQGVFATVRAFQALAWLACDTFLALATIGPCIGATSLAPALGASSQEPREASIVCHISFPFVSCCLNRQQNRA